VLLAAVRPRQLLAGKVIGIGLCGLGQLAIPVIAGLIANAVVHSAKIPSSIWLLLAASLRRAAATPRIDAAVRPWGDVVSRE
jgi:ABC-2 type transport system permease protein